MSNKAAVVGEALPNIPWEERPADCREVVWRSSRNPIIPRDLLPCSNSIFNSAAVPFEGAYAGVFRVDHRTREMRLHAGRSRDGYKWQIDEEPIRFITDDPELKKFEKGYDPRVCWIEDRYYVTWCNGYHGPTIGLAWTKDFKSFHQLEHPTMPFNRNGVLFPRRIGGKYAMLSRPCDKGHTALGDIFYSESPDLTYWGKHRFVLGPKPAGWTRTKVGAGPVPIETSEGWLLIFHGVLASCSGFVYHAGAALLDLDEPWKVRSRGSYYLLAPNRPYEWMGDVPNVVFPTAALVDAPTGRIAIYYGAADTTTCLCYGYVHEIIDHVKTCSDV
jgi:beta-1,4-mannooligosaccharide/beta-1,4-mannosyl-N-acetylglucosamine phosphorylase